MKKQEEEQDATFLYVCKECGQEKEPPFIRGYCSECWEDAGVRGSVPRKGKRKDKIYNQKQAARYLVRVALRMGYLTMPSRCERCGDVADVAAHHSDYGRALDVCWYCVDCHLLTHCLFPDADEDKQVVRIPVDMIAAYDGMVLPFP